MTGIKDALERLRTLMRASKRFSTVPDDRYYFDYNEDAMTPNITLFADRGSVKFAGSGGHELVEITVKVWRIEKALKRTSTDKLYEFVEQIRELLHAKPRLDALDGCNSSLVVDWMQRFGSKADYITDIMEVTLKIELQKTYGVV